jgi:hypothetical protein
VVDSPAVQIIRQVRKGDRPGPVAYVDFHLAVVAGRLDEDGRFISKPLLVFGTAFPVAPGIFLTAGHVYENARAVAPVVGLCPFPREPQDSRIKAYVVSAAEVHGGIDLAVLSCPDLEQLIPLPMSFDSLVELDDVRAAGYPYSIDTPRLTMVFRAFQGHIVSIHQTPNLSAEPPSYEVSFQSPRGLSGAPLVAIEDGVLTGRGYMFGQLDIDSGNMRVGCAVSSRALLSVESQMVGGPLAGLFGKDLVPLPPPLPVRYTGMSQRSPGADVGWYDDDPTQDDPTK